MSPVLPELPCFRLTSLLAKNYINHIQKDRPDANEKLKYFSASLVLSLRNLEYDVGGLDDVAEFVHDVTIRMGEDFVHQVYSGMKAKPLDKIKDLVGPMDKDRT